MKNPAAWTETKFVVRDGRIEPNSDPRYLAMSSRLAASLTAPAIGSLLQRHARGRLLDFGCGTAPLYGVYEPLTNSNLCADWVDNGYVDLVADLSGEVPLPAESFDTILVSDVLEHLPSPAVAWGEFHRLLATGGKVIANTPFAYGIHEAPHDYYRFTEHALRMHAEAAGLRVLELERVGGAVEVVADIMAKTLATRRWGGPLARAVQRVAAWFHRTGLGARIATKTSQRVPLGYTIVADKV